jgi:putative restriction endonuclease
MDAYRGRCAMCELQVGMPQAAHIKPVQYAIDDRVNNGIPLCPNHHDAFDRNQLISVNKESLILINIARVEHFQKHEIDHKIELLLGPLRENLLPPDNFADRPDPDCLEKRHDLDSSGKATNWMTINEARNRGII